MESRRDERMAALYARVIHSVCERFEQHVKAAEEEGNEEEEQDDAAREQRRAAAAQIEEVRSLHVAVVAVLQPTVSCVRTALARAAGEVHRARLCVLSGDSVGTVGRADCGGGTREANVRRQPRERRGAGPRRDLISGDGAATRAAPIGRNLEKRRNTGVCG
jgi:hypothetical protein